MMKRLKWIWLTVVLLTACTPAASRPATPPVAATATATLPPPTVAATPTLPPQEEGITPVEGWTRAQYGEAWDIAYPSGWTVNDAGAGEGALQFQGDYGGRRYEVTFSYPIGLSAQSLEAWVEEQLAPLSPDQRTAVVVSDVVVGDTAAKKVLNLPRGDGPSPSHHVYIWRTENKNPRLITIAQIDGQPVDAAAMEALLDQFIAQVQP
ncbi:MAG TPA: hypothetical protein VNK95_24875 [Caldilineaceae bacterium]|nr:hypothetical protein [Caldilineaceae bacterium]